MGNKCLSADIKSTSTVIFPAPSTSATVLSFTVPSVCTSPSGCVSAKKSTSEEASEVFSWSQMQALYLEQEELTVDNLNRKTLKTVSVVFEVVKRQLGEICGDMESGSLKMPEAVCNRFSLPFPMDISETNLSTTSNKSGINMKKMVVHFVTALYVHDMILSYLRIKDVDSALDLIKQVAVSHAIKGIATIEFRMMDWFILNYLIKNKLIHDESIACITNYLNTISNYVEKFYESQSARQIMKDKILEGEEDHTKNKARENFRLMRKWKELIEYFKDHEQYVETLLDEQTHLGEEDTLKDNDFIMKHLVAKQYELADLEDKEKGDNAPANEAPTFRSAKSSQSASTIQSGQKSTSGKSSPRSLSKNSLLKNYLA